MEALFVATFALLGLRLGLRPIGDNSFFVHLRTGMDIVDGAGIPRTDPYSFTAAGEPWVVQSWLASVLYGVLEAAGGLRAIVVFHGLLYGVLAATIAVLARAGTALRTALAALVAVGAGLPYWSPRPLALGLLAMALLVLVVERKRSPAWLIPIVWIWVNSHGSFVLGGLWIVLSAVTTRDGRSRYVPWFLAGLAAAVVNPLGWRLLLFPAALAGARENLSRVVEWQPPFQPRNPMVVVALMLVAAAVMLIAWSARTRALRLRDAAPALLFVALGLVAQRNLAPAAIVLAPVLGSALRRPEGDRVAPSPSRTNWAFAAVIAAAASLFLATAAVRPPLDLDGYPPRSLLRAAGDHARIVTTDVAGGYRILLEGKRANVFIDDRYDMYPERVVTDYLLLLDGDAAAVEILDRYGATAVIWPEREELAATLGGSPEWRRVREDGGWVVFLRASRPG